MPAVKIYLKYWCPYCQKALTLLQNRKIPCQQIDLEKENAQFFRELCEKSRMQTVPQIFHGDRLIGGFDQLNALDRQDKLCSLK